MKAIVYSRYGSPDVLQVQDVAKPIPKAGEVLVKIHTASINSWDWDLLWGKPALVRAIGGWKKPKHQVLGADIAGTVAATGKDVHELNVGDEVFGDIAGHGFGGFAEYVCVPEQLLAGKPAAMSFEQAAALPQAGLLALQGLRYKGDVHAGEKLLINGAGGGVGTLGVQYAKLRGAEVTCVDKPGKFGMLRSLGADHVIDYTKEDYTHNGVQYDRVLDVIAHRSMADYKRCLKPGGTFAMIGGSMGGLLFQMMVLGGLHSAMSGKKLGIMGYRPTRKDLDELAALCTSGKVVPVIDKCFALEETADAFRYFGKGDFVGKVIITVN